MQNFAEEFQKVRAMDTKDEFKKQLNNIESQYRDIFLKTLSRFHNDMVYSELPDKLHNIKEKLTGYTIYRNNQTIKSLNLDIQRCRTCKTETLNHIEDTNELCCQNCGLLEKVEGAAFDYKAIYKYGDYKVTKQKRSNRKYNFKYFLEKHVTDCAAQGFVCLLTQFNWLASFSRKLIQTCHEASRLHLLLSRSFRRLRKIMNGSF